MDQAWDTDLEPAFISTGGNFSEISTAIYHSGRRNSTGIQAAAAPSQVSTEKIDSHSEEGMGSNPILGGLEQWAKAPSRFPDWGPQVWGASRK